MTHSDMQPPGNKNVPEARPGYEQRKVSFHKYRVAISKGWKERRDGGNVTYNGGDYILCEREIESPKEDLVLVKSVPIDKEEPINFHRLMENLSLDKRKRMDETPLNAALRRIAFENEKGLGEAVNVGGHNIRVWEYEKDQFIAFFDSDEQFKIIAYGDDIKTKEQAIQKLLAGNIGYGAGLEYPGIGTEITIENNSDTTISLSSPLDTLPPKTKRTIKKK